MSLLALSMCIFVILCFFAQDRKLRPMTSWGLWVTWLWVVLIGTRSISSWLGVEAERESADMYLEGSIFDRNTFLLLIVAGAIILYRRRPIWRLVFCSNRWFFAFLVYCGISIIWSDYPFVSLKRWTKELGSVIMILIILTEKDPKEAVRAVFARYIYLVIPLSVILILFFPSIGTYAGEDMLEPALGGVTTNKNTLGVICFICGQFLLWELVDRQRGAGTGRDRWDMAGRCLLLCMVVWLICMAKSMTSLLCLIVGTAILLAMKVRSVKRQVSHLGTYVLLGFLMLALFLSTFRTFLHDFVRLMGRDLTLTGRTELWADLLREKINPLLGTGYQSFWLGARADSLWEKYLFHPNQAHNGYLETYLNGGMLGLFLLLATVAATWTSLKRAILGGSSFAVLLLAFLATALLFNLTEASFGRLNVLWLIVGIAALYNPSNLHWRKLPRADTCNR